MPAKRSGVFLSYARSDGEDFAASLRDRLRTHAPDIVVTRDRSLLEGGIGWWQQLAEAIDSVEFLILIMTPSSMQSENVRKEWRYARQAGVCIYPVQGTPGLEFSSLPLWMSKAHFYDLDKEWETFLAHLRRGCTTPRVPFMSPDLPDSFVQRPREFDALKHLLLSPNSGDPVAITTALSGAGGFGKTTLATAICHDEDIIQGFHQGILWVTLGQSPNLLNSLSVAYAALTGERPGFANEDDAAFQFGEKLNDRACLIVIDDVWDEFHLRPFLRGGKGCARLFTTRIAEIASVARPVNVDEMSASESFALLTKGIPGLNTNLAAQLSRRLGEWPIALELARAMMRQRIDQSDTADGAAHRLLQLLDKKGPSTLAKGTGDPRHRTIDAVLQSSLELLTPQDRTRFTELSIFPEDIAIPLSAAASLWGLDELDAEETAQRFSRLFLLKLDLGKGTMRLHDVTRSWLIAATPNPIELHNRLLNAWPDRLHLPDTYAWQWFIWHLHQAGRSEDIATTLWSPAWLRAKLNATNVNTLIDDFDHLKPDPNAELIQGALRLSSHILARDPQQFPSQIVGRLLPFNENPAIYQFINGFTKSVGHPWLRPLRPTLDPPGTALIRTLSGHSDSVRAVAVTPDGQTAISASEDHTLKVWDIALGHNLHTLSGHSNSVKAVAVTPDGQTAISASYDHTLKIWDITSGRELHTLSGHSDSIRAVAITPDGQTAISASYDHTLKIWDITSGRELHTLSGHSNWVTAVAVTQNGRTAVSASEDRTLKVWDITSGRERYTLSGHSDSIRAVAVTPDGRTAVSVSEDRTLKIWDITSRHELHTLSGHSNWATAVAVTTDGQTAVSASEDHTLKVWDITSGRERYTLSGHSDSIRAVAVTPDGRTAISASDDRTLKVWDITSGRERYALSGHSDWVAAVAVTPDGRTTISASDDNTLKVWDITSGRERYALSGHSDWVAAVAVTPDSRTAISASADRTLKVWDVTSGQERCTLSGHSYWVAAVAVTPDGQTAISASGDKTLKIWDIASGRERYTLSGHSDLIRAVAVTPDGQTAISASEDNTLKVWDIASGRERYTLFGHSSWVRAVAVTPDGRTVISASRDSTLKVWDIASGHDLHTLSGHSDSIRAVAVTPDGQTAISASEDNTLRVWDIASGHNLHTLSGHSDSIRGVAVTRDGQTAISASGDNTLRVWDIASGHNLHTLSGHSDSVRAVAVTPDGQTAISASGDNTLKVWDIASGQAIFTFNCDARAICCALIDNRTIVVGDGRGKIHFLRLELA